MLRRTVLAAAALAITLSAPAVAAGPDLTPGPDLYPGFVTQKNVDIPMSDGTVLRADVTRPIDADGNVESKPLPVILTQTPYNKAVLGGAPGSVATLAGAPPLLVTHGYVAVSVDVRGTGNSQGAWESFGLREQKDSMEIAAWLNQQPWSDGTFGMYGASYMAINQFLTAAQHPPGLKAMFPIIPAADVYRDVVWHGGSVDAGFIPLWMGLTTGLGLIPTDTVRSDPLAALQLLLERVTTGTEFQTTALTALATGQDLAYDGDFYRERSPESVVDRIDVPTFITGGWWDLFQRGEPRLYNALRLPPGQKQLMMGPWYHVTAGRGLGVKDTPPLLPVLGLAWFDRWMKGIRNGVEDFGPVSLFELGAEKWVTQDSYPGTRAYKRLYLRAGKGLSEDPPASASTDTVLANPINGLCNRQTAQWTAGILIPGEQCTDDERLYEASGLTYTTPPLTQDLRLVGPLGLHLNASTTAADTTWIATLTDVSPDGKSDPLTSGWLMPSRRAVDRARSELTPAGDLIAPFHPFTRASLQTVPAGAPTPLDIELFGTDVVFKTGHRVRVVLTHGDLPHLLSTVPDTAKQLGAIDRVHIDPSQPSFLTVGELTSSSLSGARSCVSRRVFSIRLQAPRRGVKIRRAVVKIGSRSVKVTRRGSRAIARVDLRGRPRSRVTVRVTITGSDGRSYREQRSYRTCIKRR